MTRKQIDQIVAICPLAPESSRLEIQQVFGLRRDTRGRSAHAMSDRPDAGWRIANELAARTGGKQPAIPDKPAFRWVRAAVALLTGRAASPDAGTAQEAVAISKDSHLRPILEAALVAPDGSPEAVAVGLGLEPDLVACYADLFFSVPDRRGELSYVHRIVYGDRAGAGDPDSPSLMAVALKTDLATLLAVAGYRSADRDGCEAPQLARQLMAETMAEARIQLAAGGLRQSRPAPVLVHAMRILGGMSPQDLQPAGEGGPSLLSEILRDSLEQGGAAIREEARQKAYATEQEQEGGPPPALQTTDTWEVAE